jgi:hypothetical protein
MTVEMSSVIDLSLMPLLHSPLLTLILKYVMTVMTVKILKLYSIYIHQQWYTPRTYIYVSIQRRILRTL